MVGNNKYLLQRIIESPRINTILEIGSGLCSTPLIRKALKIKGKGYCLSIEDKESWYSKVLKTIPNDRFGRVERHSLIWNDNRLIYDYDHNEKFDFILIDAPTLHISDDKILYNKLVSFLSNENIWVINSIAPKGQGGSSSSHILEYTYKFFHNNTITLVDRRRRAVYYYLQQYADKNVFNFYGWKHNKWGDRFNFDIDKIHLKEKYIDIAKKFSPSKATLICLKENEMLKNLCQEQGIEIYDYLKDHPL